jgi:hypothetical protein
MAMTAGLRPSNIKAAALSQHFSSTLTRVGAVGLTSSTSMSRRWMQVQFLLDERFLWQHCSTACWLYCACTPVRVQWLMLLAALLMHCTRCWCPTKMQAAPQHWY